MGQLLLLGESKERAEGLRSLLRGDGHRVTWERSIDAWRDRERALGVDLVIATVDKPGNLIDGARRSAGRFPTPVLIVQQEADLWSDLFSDERLVDRIRSPFQREELLGRVDALIRVRDVVLGGGATVPSASERGAAGGRLTRWFRSRVPQNSWPLGPYLEVGASVALWADRRDGFAPGHAERVATTCALMAEVLRMGSEETATFLRAALLHDIGKVGLPAEILHQRGPLDEPQLRMIRTHPAKGAALLRALDPDPEVAKLVLYHHECPNGHGYYGKEPASIPRSASLLGVAEAFDAMVYSRLREPLTHDGAIERLREQRGESYSAEAVDALTDAVRPRGREIPLSV